MREWQGSSTRWYTESTLKSDTKPATIAFRNRVAEVTLKDAVKEDKLSNGLVENAVMLLRGVIRTIKCHVESCTQEELWEDSPILPWLVEHAGSRLSREGSRRSDATRKIAWQEAYTRVCAIRREGAGETTFFRTVEQNESQIQVRSVAGSEKQQCRVLRGDGRRCVFRAREVSRIEHQDRWDKEAINNVIGVPWRIADGKWIVDRPATQN